MEILVTGANRGIGAALLDVYAALGTPAMGTSRDGAVGLKLDVTDPDSISELGRHYAEGHLDLLVCNAAVFLDRGLGSDHGCERHRSRGDRQGPPARASP